MRIGMLDLWVFVQLLEQSILEDMHEETTKGIGLVKELET